MIKVFTLNNYGKIELTKEELQSLLDEAYWEGRKSVNTWTYTTSTPIYTWSTSTPTNITANTNNENTIFLNGGLSDSNAILKEYNSVTTSATGLNNYEI